MAVLQIFLICNTAFASSRFERVFIPIQHALRLIKGDVFNAEAFYRSEERFPYMRKRDGAVMWVVLGDQDVPVKAAHFRYGENADTAERASRDGKNLSLCDVAVQRRVCAALQAEERNLSGL